MQHIVVKTYRSSVTHCTTIIYITNKWKIVGNIVLDLIVGTVNVENFKNLEKMDDLNIEN